MVDQLPVGVAVLDATGEVIWRNDLASRLIGAQSSAPSPLVAEAGHALRGGIVRDVRVTVDGTDGSPRVIELTAAHVARHGGAALIFTDVTERERVAKAETEFVENAAHQLRNPIAAISGSVAALEAGAENDDAERAKFISHIARESNRLAALVEALLTLAGLERGGGATLIELVPLRPLLDEVVASTELHDGVRVVVDCTGPIAVVGDRDLFVEAVGNVVTNAAQHTERGEIRIAATLEGKTVVLDVTDGGPGVPDELTGPALRSLRPDVGQRPARIRPRPRDRPRGNAGRGLAPRAVAARQQRRRNVPVHDAGSAASVSRVLVVDDEEAIRDALAYSLRAEGLEVECREDGLSAVDAVAESAFDVVLLDVMLPEHLRGVEEATESAPRATSRS